MNDQNGKIETNPIRKEKEMTDLVISTEDSEVVFFEEEVDENARGFYNIGGSN